MLRRVHRPASGGGECRWDVALLVRAALAADPANRRERLRRRRRSSSSFARAHSMARFRPIGSIAGNSRRAESQARQAGRQDGDRDQPATQASLRRGLPHEVAVRHLVRPYLRRGAAGLDAACKESGRAMRS